jgi:uncharacterized membrane protein YsdA (DUF1294 family)/cold shock CspA family protein
METKAGTARRQGVMKNWDDARGFGFIAPHDGGPQVFAHARHCTLQRMQRPQAGLEVTFDVVRAEDGRLQARKVLPRHGWTAVDRLPDGALRQRRAEVSEHGARARQERLTERRTERQEAHQWGAASYFAIAGLVVLLAVLSVGWRMPGWVWGAYTAVSVVTFLLYHGDKRAAQAHRWRVPESRLLLAGLLGGWPGAIVAQQTLRHKSAKASFRVAFWGTVVLNLGAVMVWAMLGLDGLHALVR